MDDRLRIKVSFEIDQLKELQQIQAKIKLIEKKLKGIDIKINTEQATKNVEKLNVKAKELGKNMGKASTNVKGFKESTNSATKSTKMLDNSLVQAFAKFTIWKVIGDVIFGIANAIKSLGNNVMDLELEMTNFAIVSDATEQELGAVDARINSLVTSLGALKTEVTGAATEFARAGFNIADSMELAESAIIGARVGFSDLDTVSRNLIATLKGFRLDASDSANVINDLFVASKTAAITFDGLGEAIRRSGNSMAFAGATFEETTALISGANESAQDASKVGSALKTISARLRGVDAANNMPKLTAQMREFGVEIEDGAGGFRNIYDIMQDLAVEFENSTDEFQKQAIAESLAGKRRSNILLGLLSNWEQVEKVKTRTMESTIEAEEAQNDILETSRGQIEKMAGGWQLFAQNVLDSDLILKSLQLINKELDDINAKMQVEETLFDEDFGANLGFDADEYLNRADVRRGDVDLAQVIFGMTNEQLMKKNSELFDSLRDMTQSELSEMDELYTTQSETLGRYETSIKNVKKQIKDLREEQNTAGYDEKLAIQQNIEGLEVTLDNLESKSKNLLISLGKEGILGKEGLENFVKSIKDNLDETTEALENKTEVAVEMLGIESAEYERYVRHFSDLTDDQKNDMQDLLQEDVDTTLRRIQASKDRIRAYQSETNIYQAAIRDRINAMAGLSMVDEVLNERMIIGMQQRAQELAGSDALKAIIDKENANLNELLGTYDKLISEKNKYFGDDKDDKSTSTSKEETQLEKDLRDVQFAIDEVENALKMTDDTAYEERVKLYNDLIELSKDEKTALENLAGSVEEGSKEWQKYMLDIGKTEKAMYDYMQSTEETKQAQEDFTRTVVDENISSMEDRYSDMFDGLKEKYKEDLDKFKELQEEKIKAVDKEIKELKERYEKEDFVDEEEKILDRIANLEKTREKLAIDTSLEAKNRRSEIEKELAEEEENLDKVRTERNRELTLQELEDKKEGYQEEIDEREKAYDKQIKKLEDYMDEVDDLIKDFQDDWSTYGDDLGSAFEEGFMPAIKNILNEINKIPNVDVEMPTEEEGNSKPPTQQKPELSSSDKKKIETYKKAWELYDKSEKEGRLTPETAARYKEMANEKANAVRAKYGYSGGASGDDFIPTYHDGGVIGDTSMSIADYMSTMQSNERLIKAEVGENILSKQDSISVKDRLSNGNVNVDRLFDITGNISINDNYGSTDEFIEEITEKTRDSVGRLGKISLRR